MTSQRPRKFGDAICRSSFGEAELFPEVGTAEHPPREWRPPYEVGGQNVVDCAEQPSNDRRLTRLPMGCLEFLLLFQPHQLNHLVVLGYFAHAKESPRGSPGRVWERVHVAEAWRSVGWRGDEVLRRLWSQ